MAARSRPVAAPTAAPDSPSAYRSSKSRSGSPRTATAPLRRFSKRSRTRHRFTTGRDTSPGYETPHTSARPAEAFGPKRRPRWSPLPRPPGAFSFLDSGRGERRVAGEAIVRLVELVCLEAMDTRELELHRHARLVALDDAAVVRDHP